MRHELNNTTLTLAAEPGDGWSGTTTARCLGAADGHPVLRCGEVKRSDGRFAELIVRLDTRPDLAAAALLWHAANAAATEKARQEEAERVAEHEAMLHRADREVQERVADVLLHLLADVLLHLGEHVRLDTHDDGRILTLRPGRSDPMESEFVAWGSPGDARKLRERIAEVRAGGRARIEAWKAEQARIEEAREAIVARGEELATPAQVREIDRAREAWFDLFDGAGPQMPTDERLRTLTRDEAAALLVAICDARKALRREMNV